MINLQYSAAKLMMALVYLKAILLCRVQSTDMHGLAINSIKIKIIVDMFILSDLYVCFLHVVGCQDIASS